MNIAIRLAGLEDIEQLSPLFDGYRQFYGQASDLALARRFLSERIAQRQSVILLACDQAGLGVGFTQLYPSFSSVRAAPIYLLNDLYVASAARGRGVGRDLLQAAAAHARATGAIRMVLSTAHDNATAQRLYEAQGWRREDAFYEYALAL
ncbi:MAG: GNAT family N-acetyltransferase [Dyella sp.]